MKKILTVLIILWNSALAEQGDFTVGSIGSSKNTNTIFMETEIPIPKTTCENKYLFRFEKDDVDADRFISIALAAQAQGKMITIDYVVDGCIQNGTAVRVFRLRN